MGLKDSYFKKYKAIEYQSDLFVLFIEKGFQLLRKQKGGLAFIIPNSITNNLNNSKIRNFILNNSAITSLVDAPLGVFESATVDTVILCTSLPKIKREINCLQIINNEIVPLQKKNQQEFEDNLNSNFDFLISDDVIKILKKIEKDTVILDSICDSSSGIKEYETGKGIPPQKEIDRVNKIFNSDKKLSKDYWVAYPFSGSTFGKT